MCKVEDSHRDKTSSVRDTFIGTLPSTSMPFFPHSCSGDSSGHVSYYRFLYTDPVVISRRNNNTNAKPQGLAVLFVWYGKHISLFVAAEFQKK